MLALVCRDCGARRLWHPAAPVGLCRVDPRYGLDYLLSGGLQGFLVLGGVFLCVTGAEALYADMGHFGPKPIRFVVEPHRLSGPDPQLRRPGRHCARRRADRRQYLLPPVPRPLLTPLIVLATIATVIASQSIITGAYSMTRQAIQLGWLPRLDITQTSEEGYGQIYVGAVNWLLMIVTLGLTIGFGKSDNLAAAYGIAVSPTMLMTSCSCSSPCARSGVGRSGPRARSRRLFCHHRRRVSSPPTWPRCWRAAMCRCCWLRWSMA